MTPEAIALQQARQIRRQSTQLTRDITDDRNQTSAWSR